MYELCIMYSLLSRPTNAQHYIYSGPPIIERFDARTTWNLNKKFEKNSVLKRE